MALKNVAGTTATPVNPTKVGDSGSASKTGKASDTSPMTVGKAGAVTTDGKGKGVDVNVSDRARSRAAEQKKATELAMNAPEVREDRVAAIKAQIDAGTYKVDSGKIADGMVREAVMEHLASDLNK